MGSRPDSKLWKVRGHADATRSQAENHPISFRRQTVGIACSETQPEYKVTTPSCLRTRMPARDVSASQPGQHFIPNQQDEWERGVQEGQWPTRIWSIASEKMAAYRDWGSVTKVSPSNFSVIVLTIWYCTCISQWICIDTEELIYSSNLAVIYRFTECMYYVINRPQGRASHKTSLLKKLALLRVLYPCKLLFFFKWVLYNILVNREFFSCKPCL